MNRPPSIRNSHPPRMRRLLLIAGLLFTGGCASVPDLITHRAVVSGNTQTSRIEAKALWNDTGIRLRKGSTYQVRISGEWNDWFVPCDANGPKPAFWNGLMGSMRFGLRFPPSRDPETHYFRPVACIGTPPAGTAAPAGAFLLRDGMTFTAPASGSLHVFANDDAFAYSNNEGALSVRITRVGQ